MKKYLIMKKFIILMCLAGILSSCAKVEFNADKVSSTSEKREITFSTNATATRSVVSGSSFTTGYFGVYGRVESGTYVASAGYLIDNGKFNASGANAGKAAEGTYYWPKSDNNTNVNVDFVAIYPYDGLTYSRTNDDVTVTLDSDEVGSESSIDVLYAVAHNQHHQVVGTNNSSEPAHASVPLTFKHALSLVEFQGKYATGNNISAVTVKKIEFLQNDGSTAWAIVKDGTLVFDMTDIESSTSDVSPYVPDFTLGSTTVNNLNFGDDVALTSSYSTISSSILVPQTVPAKVRITFDITIQNTTGEAITFAGRQVTKIINTGSDMSTGSAHAYNVASWASGHHYIYRYNITAEDVDFTITVDNWSAPSGWQVWDHDAYAYVERFFVKASTLMGVNSKIA